MVAVEVTTHSPGAVVQATLERAVSSDSGRACPLLWRCYLRYEAYRGRRDAARRLFLRAIAACPWAKAVWCDGLALLNGHAPPKELSGAPGGSRREGSFGDKGEGRLLAGRTAFGAGQLGPCRLVAGPSSCGRSQRLAIACLDGVVLLPFPPAAAALFLTPRC